jgi:DNA-binding MurR/RpiR family transcriptional regulator
MSTASITDAIDQRFDMLSPELQRAARWVREHAPSMALLSMRRIAREAGVSPATMSRLARRLGFLDFEALRRPFVELIAPNRAPLPPMRSGARRAEAARAQAMVRAQQANLVALPELNDASALDAAADALLAAQHVAFLGLRVNYAVAFHLYYVHGLIATNGRLLTDLAGTLADQVGKLGPRDVLVAISQSPYTRQTVDAVARARAQGVSIVALTDSALSPIARGADHVLRFQAQTASFFHSTSGALGLAELLIDAAYRRGGSTTRRQLERTRGQLKTGRAYWERPAAPVGA